MLREQFALEDPQFAVEEEDQNTNGMGPLTDSPFQGRLKSFSPKDGYGFISSPQLYNSYGRDIYIQKAQLPHLASCGACLQFHIRLNARGQPQAYSVVLVEDPAEKLAEATAKLNRDFLTFESVGRGNDPLSSSEYNIVLVKSVNSRLGIDVDRQDGISLLIEAVTPGLVNDWNKACPHHLRVDPGDRIIRVNGTTGNAIYLLDECQMSSRLEIVLRRGAAERLGGESVLPTFRIVTWNVLAGAYAGLKMYPDVEPSVLTAPRRRAQVAAVMSYLAADVICLQEVDCTLEELGIMSNDYDSVFTQRPDGRCDRCVIAWRRDRLERGAAGHRDIFFDDHPPPAAFGCDPAHYESGNVGVAIELRIRGDYGGCVTVATTHLCWEPSKMDVRAWQLHTFYEAVSGLGGQRIVLCGDLNAQPGTQAHQFLARGCSLNSAYADVEASALTNSNAHAFPQGFAAMIDYIWYSPKWFSVKQRIKLPTGDDLKKRAQNGMQQQKALENDAVPTLLGSDWPSDHIALATDLTLVNPVMTSKAYDGWDD